MSAMECLAVVGSPSVFGSENPDLFVPYVVIQWYSNGKDKEGKATFHQHCKEEVQLKWREFFAAPQKNPPSRDRHENCHCVIFVPPSLGL